VTMDVMYGNDRALAMIKGHWPAARARRSRDCYTICVQLVNGEQHRPQELPRAGSRQPALLAAAGRV
jgi:hypothetical protein